MQLKRALLVARKEWAELLGNKLLLVSMSALPVVFTLMPVVIVLVAVAQAGATPPEKMHELTQMVRDAPTGSTPEQLAVLLIVRNWVGMFLILPVFVPIVVSAQAVVGEKERRTIEPLLAAPISSEELLLGKTLASLVPGVLITWLAFLVFAAGIDLVAWPHFHRLVLPDVSWAIAILLVAPALALFGNGLSVLVSSRVNDARLAQQLAGTAVLPLVAVFVTQMARGVAFGPSFYVVALAVLLVIDLVVYRLAVRLFDRERILTSLR